VWTKHTLKFSLNYFPRHRRSLSFILLNLKSTPKTPKLSDVEVWWVKKMAQLSQTHISGMVVLQEILYVNFHLLNTNSRLGNAQISVNVFWLVYKLLLNFCLIVRVVNFTFLGEVSTLWNWMTWSDRTCLRLCISFFLHACMGNLRKCFRC